MAFFERWKEKISLGTLDRRKNKNLRYVKYGSDPRNEWREVREIGDGSFGKVYLTKNTKTDREAALKQMEIQDESDLESFAVEIKILTEHKHPNIVSLYETYFFEDKLWLYMEYCEAGAIDTIMLDLDKPLNEPQIASLCSQTCAALDFLHSPKVMVIHRDLKAGNLLLDSAGTIKLADFGVSAQIEVSKPYRDSSVGTPYWMAPEVIQCETSKEEPYNFKADVWSLGITLIECAQVHPPHNDLQPMRVLFRIIKSPPPTLNKPSDWSADFNSFLTKCLVKEPKHRASSSQLLKHPFISKIGDNKRALKQLYLETTAEITDEIKEEIDEDWNNSEQISSTSSSLIDLSSNYSKSAPSTPQDTLPKPTIIHKTPSPTSSINKSPNPTHQPPSLTNKSPPPTRTKKPAPLPPTTLNKPSKLDSKPLQKSPTITINPSTTNKNDMIYLEISSNNRASVLPYLELTSVHTDIVNELVDEVITSNHHKPSIPSVVLDVIVNAIDTSNDDDEEDDGGGDVAIKISNEDGIDLTKVSDSRLHEACVPVCNELIDEVLCSTHRQPSVSGVVLDMMTELIEGVEDGDNGGSGVGIGMVGGGRRVGVGTVVGDGSGGKFDGGRVSSSTGRVSGGGRLGDGTADGYVANGADNDSNIIVTSKGLPSKIDNAGYKDVNNNERLENGNIGRSGGIKNKNDYINKNVKNDYKNKDETMKLTLPLVNGIEKHNSHGKTTTKQGGNDTNDMNSVRERKIESSVEGASGTGGSASASVSGGGSNSGGSVGSVMEKTAPRRNAFKRTLTRTRKFSTVDGETTTTTTTTTILNNQNKQLIQHELMKRNLREMKRQKNMEKKQLLNLDLQIKYKLCDLANKVEKQKMTAKKVADLELEQNISNGKQEMKKLEESFNVELKVQEKRLKMEQDKSLKLFMEQQKKDLKTLKSDLKGGTLSKKDATLSKNSAMSEQAEKERNFHREQSEGMEMMRRRLLQSQKKMRGDTEMKLMEKRHRALKSRENEIWKIELEGKREQRELTQKHLRNMFVLKRQHMMTRHNMEMQALYKANEELVDDLKRKHNIEKKQLPKTEKQNSKASYVAFKKSLKDTGEAGRKKLAEFEEKERKRIEKVLGRMRVTQEKEEQAINNENQLKITELEQIQQEKLEMLKKQETDMLAALKQNGVEEEVKHENQIMRSRQKLQKVFDDEIKAHNQFYYGSPADQQTNF